MHFRIRDRRVIKVVLSILLFEGAGLYARAQPTNSWIAPGSGNWDDASAWSLGVRPDSSQSVLITNEGWRAVAIDASTLVNSPGSMTVSGLAIGGDTNSQNVLLLNYVGTATPLAVLNSLSVETNGRIFLLYSGLRVNGAAHVGGVFDQEGGEFTFTNPAATTMRVEGGTFNLTNGFVAGANMYLGGTNAGYVNQDSGLVSLSSLSLSSSLYYPNDRTGHYLFQSGWLVVDGEEDVGGTLTQKGGTNSANALSVTSGTYTKNGGALFAGEVLVDPPSGPLPPDATVTQTGGSAVITNDLHLFSPGGGPHPGVAAFNMDGGSLSAESMLLENASSVYQSNGTVSVATEIALNGAGDFGSYGQYILSGGTLDSSNIVILSQGFFEHTGGTLTVTNLSITGSDAVFQLRAGAVTAKNIVLTGNVNAIQPPVVFVYNAPSFLVTNEAISLVGGVIVIQDSAQQFGRLTLQTDSGISLAGGSAVLQFADSHANSWNGQLKVYNWSGSTNGGGADQLIFGTSSSALTLGQAGQIQFINPAGLSSGTYAGRILSTGEVVPDTGSTAGGGSLVNNWTNPASAKWESPYWSLGILPAADQTVNVTNDGYKAVNIDSTTISGYSSSLTVSNLFVSAPSNALSTVLLNYAGFATPLKVLNNCVIGANGTLDNFSSSFEVDASAGGQLLVEGGTFTQLGGQTVVNAPVLVSSGGSLNATNGNLTLGDVTLGTTNLSGTFEQDGGSIAMQRLSIQSGGYTLYSGVLYAIGGTELDAFGGFLQWGGTNYGDITVNATSSGAYTMDGGLVQGNVLTIPGSFYQGGGLVDMQTVDWTGNNGNVLSYGTLRARSINIHRGALVFMGQGGFTPGIVEADSLTISNSAHVDVTTYNLFVTNSLMIRGDSSNNPARLLVTGGTQVGTILNAGTITVGDNAVIDHGYNAATELSSGLSMSGGQYSLEGGFLEGPQVGVGANATFTHSGGTNVVHGVLSISGTYDLGARLLADGIYLRGSLLLEAGTLANSGLIDLGGRIGIGAPDGSGGQVRLSTNAVIGFIGTTTNRQLHFAASSAVAWTPGAVLVISNWNNSGSTDLFFGTDASGLTASQLGQITFLNPGGFAPGNYGAQLLSTGELVPAAAGQPTLQSTRYGSGLVLSWPGGYELLSATNITGPFSPVNGASSPWTNSFSKPMEFFRLRGL